jgi:hypothetical protein
MDTLQNGFTTQGFIDNLVYPLIVAAILGALALIFSRLRKKRVKQISPIITFSLDETNAIRLKTNELTNKVSLLRRLIRTGKVDGKFVVVKPTFPLSKIKTISKEEYLLKLSELERLIEKKIEILLMRVISNETEDIENIIFIFQRIVDRKSPNVTELIKIDIYRQHHPEIYFPIHVTQIDFESIAQNDNKTTDDIKLQLRIPTMTSMAIFPKDIFLKYVVPGLVDEIYRIHKNHNFDLTTLHWENLYAYEVGLG